MAQKSSKKAKQSLLFRFYFHADRFCRFLSFYFCRDGKRFEQITLRYRTTEWFLPFHVTDGCAQLVGHGGSSTLSFTSFRLSHHFSLNSNRSKCRANKTCKRLAAVFRDAVAESLARHFRRGLSLQAGTLAGICMKRNVPALDLN